MRGAAAFVALFLASTSASGVRAFPAPIGTIRILAVRIQFPEEVPDLISTTGSGRFDLRPRAEARATYRFPFDLPPHDRAFYAQHLTALANLYRGASGGQLELAFEVWPTRPQGAYELERAMATFGNGRTDSEREIDWVELLRDAVSAVSATEGNALDFDRFDSICVIHAGVFEGRLNDIAPVYLSPDDLDRILGGPIRTPSGTVRDGWLVPQAMSTDGVAGLNSTMAGLFAFQLGLPSLALSTPQGQVPAIGGWSILDAGVGNLVTPPGRPEDDVVIGYLPPLLGAWARTELGWIEPLVVSRDTTVTLLAATDPESLQAVKVPIGPGEYFLLENRYRGEGPLEIELSDGNEGVWLDARPREWAIPGSGLLIWHVDERRIESARAAGEALNNDPLKRSIHLEEADGFEDIGNAFVTLFDPRVSEFAGGESDPFKDGTVFGPGTQPSTHTNAGAETGVEITAPDPAAERIQIEIRFRRNLPGWPVQAPDSLAGAPVVADFDGDGQPEVAAVTRHGEAVIWNAGARTGSQKTSSTREPVLSAPVAGDLDSDGAVDLVWVDGAGMGHALILKMGSREGFLQVIEITLGHIALGRPTVAGAPLVIEHVLSNTETPELIFAGTDGQLSISPGLGAAGSDPLVLDAGAGQTIVGLAAGDVTSDGLADIVTVNANGLVSLVDDGELRLLGRFVTEPTGGPVLGDLDGDGTLEVVVAGTSGEVTALEIGPKSERFGIVVDATGPMDGFPMDVGSPLATAPALADINDDGRLEIIVLGPDRVHAVRFNGVVQAGFPVRFPVTDAPETRPTRPVILKPEGEPALIFFGLDDGRVLAMEGPSTGVEARENLAMPGDLASAPTLADLDGDGRVEIVAATVDGLIQARPLPYTASPQTLVWSAPEADAARTSRFGGPRGNAPATVEALMPESSVYCYPNPVGPETEGRFRFFLSETARVDVQIFNLAGELVDTFGSGPEGFGGGTENEITWDTSKLGSGFYLARLAARANGRTDVALVKTAVVK